MKKTTYLFFLFILIISFSCEKEPSRANGDESQFKVDFDGQTFVANRIHATIINDQIRITGVRGDNDELIILNVIANAEGVYQIGIQNGTLMHTAEYIEQNSEAQGSWMAHTDGISSQGIIIISNINQSNKTISGSFSFTGNNPIAGTSNEFIREFTNGSFSNLPYLSE